MKPSSLAAALLLPLAVLAQPAPLLSIDDPEGDDVGDGALVYPRDSGYEPGDLDLRSLRVFADGKDLRFEATFRNPIRDPATMRGAGLGNVDLSVFARRGFYAFNLDIYLDTDRVYGSGNTVTLPGRHATFDPAHGWEKAIVLTPRPELMRRLLADALTQASPNAPGDVEATIDKSIFFATDVRVRGRTVSFAVPTSFVDAPTLLGASLTAMVTMAKPTVEADINLLGNNAHGSLERLTLGAAQPEPGRPLLAMGYDGNRAPATAIVDLLSPDKRQQSLQLAAGALLTGLNRDNQMGAAQTLAAAPPLPAVAADAVLPAARGESWFSRALGSLSGLFGAGSAAAPAPAPAASAPSLQMLMTPPAATAPAITPTPAVTPAPSAPPAAPRAAAAVPAVVVPVVPATASRKPRDPAFFEEQELRLRTLERLRKSGLITEAEYQQKRKEVLDSL